MSSYSETFQGAIGIDLGTTLSVCGIWQGSEVVVPPDPATGQKLVPSAVTFTSDHIPLVGNDAFREAAKAPQNFITHSKRFIGRPFTDLEAQEDMQRASYRVSQDVHGYCQFDIVTGEKTHSYRPEQIGGLILSKMRQVAENYLGKNVTKAVVTVPAYFNDNQRRATQSACQLAGLNCLRIIAEPTAACMAYNLHSRQDGNFVIFDLGGGTLDLSLIRAESSSLEVKAVTGNSHLGGLDFDNLVADYIIVQFIRQYKNADELRTAEEIERRIRNDHKLIRKIMRASEEAKKALSSTLSTTVSIENMYNGEDFELQITRSQFERLVDPLFRKCMQLFPELLKASNLTADQIDEIVLVGGSSRIPKLQELISSYFNGKPLNKSVNPDEVVAVGAAIQGAILTRTDESCRTNDIQLLDVLPLSIGVETQGGQMTKLINRNETIPIKKDKIFTTTEDNQTTIVVNVGQGERPFMEHNVKLASFQLSGIRPAPRRVAKIKVTMQIDENGVLSVSAQDLDTGLQQEIKVGSESSHLSPEEVERMLHEADAFRHEDRLRQESLTACERLSRYLNQTTDLIANPELQLDDEGNPILQQAERHFVEQYILNTYQWLEMNRDQPKEAIDAAAQALDKQISPILMRLYTRIKQIKSRKELEDSRAKRSDMDQPIDDPYAFAKAMFNEYDTNETSTEATPNNQDDPRS